MSQKEVWWAQGQMPGRRDAQTVNALSVWKTLRQALSHNHSVNGKQVLCSWTEG